MADDSQQSPREDLGSATSADAAMSVAYPLFSIVKSRGDFVLCWSQFGRYDDKSESEEK